MFFATVCLFVFFNHFFLLSIDEGCIALFQIKYLQAFSPFWKHSPTLTRYFEAFGLENDVLPRRSDIFIDGKKVSGSAFRLVIILFFFLFFSFLFILVLVAPVLCLLVWIYAVMIVKNSVIVFMEYIWTVVLISFSFSFFFFFL